MLVSRFGLGLESNRFPGKALTPFGVDLATPHGFRLNMRGPDVVP
jgi:hypothetical protein